MSKQLTENSPEFQYNPQKIGHELDWSLAVSGKNRDRNRRSQSLIFFEQYCKLTVKLMPLLFHAKYTFSVSSKTQSNEAHQEGRANFCFAPKLT